MSAFKGTLFLYNNGKTLEYYAANCGPSPGVLTHNIRKNEEEALNEARNAQHDDNARYGHGYGVPPGTVEKPGIAVGPAFEIGGNYRTGSATGQYRDGWEKWENVVIGPESWIRIGFRGRAFAVAQVPKKGELVEIPYEKMISQQGRSGMDVHNAYLTDHCWDTAPMKRDGTHVPAQLTAIAAARDPRIVEGQVRIVPVADPRNRKVLKGWDVWFENQIEKALKDGQTQGFIGTVVVVDSNGNGIKNAGLGLESMPCPMNGSAARQFISCGMNYGNEQTPILAVPNAFLRLGVRGHSTLERVVLPSLQAGAAVIPLSTFERTTGSYQSSWFDSTALRPKLAEKMFRVDFFQNDLRINDRLQPVIYTGAEAQEKAEFKDPPRVVIKQLPKSAEHPLGAWRVTMTNRLVDHDDIGPVGFVGRLKIIDGKKIKSMRRVLRPYAFTPTKREHSWIIPVGAKIGEKTLRAGSRIVVDTGPLAWRITLKLPAIGKRVDTLHRKQWVLAESEYLRAGLTPKPPRSKTHNNCQ